MRAGANISRQGGDSEEKSSYFHRNDDRQCAEKGSLRFGHAELIGAALTAVPPKPLVCLR